MVQNKNGTYRYSGSASGVQYWDGKRYVDSNSAAGKAFAAKRQATANEWATKQNQAEAAAVDTQEVEDRQAENKSRNADINALAAQQAARGVGGAGGGGGLGRGIYQRRQQAIAPNSALNQLNSANAAALAAARKKQLAAQQAANPLRQPGTSIYGYAADIQKRLAGGLT